MGRWPVAPSRWVDAASCLVAQLGIESHRLDARGRRTERWTPALVAAGDQCIDVVAALDLLGETLNVGVGDPGTAWSSSPGGAIAHHYQLTDRDRVAAIVWGTRAELPVTDFERQNGRDDVIVLVDSQAVVELHEITASYLARLGELGLQTCERRNGDDLGERSDRRGRPARDRRGGGTQMIPDE